jgi:hypothetical protein
VVGPAFMGACGGRLSCPIFPPPSGRQSRSVSQHKMGLDRALLSGFPWIVFQVVRRENGYSGALVSCLSRSARTVRVERVLLLPLQLADNKVPHASRFFSTSHMHLVGGLFWALHISGFIVCYLLNVMSGPRFHLNLENK